MTYDEARQRALIYRVIGILILVICFVIFLITFLKTAYYNLGTDGLLFGRMVQLIKNAIATIYHEIPLVDLIWPYAPTANLDQYSSAANIPVAMLFVGLWIGGAITRLGNEISAQLREVDEEIARTQIRGSVIPSPRRETMDVRIRVSVPKSSLWNALWTSLLAPIIAAVITAGLLALLNLS